jgi:hypothetical protein
VLPHDGQVNFGKFMVAKAAGVTIQRQQWELLEKDKLGSQEDSYVAKKIVGLLIGWLNGLSNYSRESASQGRGDALIQLGTA